MVFRQIINTSSGTKHFTCNHGFTLFDPVTNSSYQNNKQQVDNTAELPVSATAMYLVEGA